MMILCRNIRGVCAGVLAAAFFCAPAAYADASGTAYRVENGRLRFGGHVGLASLSYSLESGGIDFIQNSEMQGTQFKMEAGPGTQPMGGSFPQIESVVPADYARFYSDENAAFSVTAEDPEGGPLEYQLKQDGAVKIPFQAAKVLSCALTPADLGRRSFAIEVRDSDGTVSAAREAYILRKPLK